MGVTSLGRHTRPACHQALFEIVIKKSWFWPPYSVFFMDFWGCEGSGASFHGLRMRSRSTRKCAHRNAGDLGSSLAVCACAYDPIHVTAQGKSLGPNCACVQPPRHYRGLPMNAYVLYPMLPICTLIGRERSREFFDDVFMLMSHVTTFSLSDWLRATFAALWLVTDWSSHVYYCWVGWDFSCSIAEKPFLVGLVAYCPITLRHGKQT